MRIPIVTKLIVITVLILLAATIPISIKSSQLFEKISLQREEYSNLATASAKATELENMLVAVTDKVKVVGLILLKNATDSENSAVEKNIESTDLDFNFEKDKNLLNIEVYKLVSDKFILVSRKTKDEVKVQYNLSPKFFDDLRVRQNFPLRNVVRGQVEVRNGSFPKSPPIFTVGIPIVKDETGVITHIALADFDFSLIQKPFAEQTERIMYAIDRDGMLLAHQDEARALARHKMDISPIVQKCLGDNTPRRQTRFVDPEYEGSFVGAYAKTSLGVSVITQTAQDIILEPAREVKRQAIFITGIVLSGALFFIFIFSMSLTSPIEKLAELIKQVSRGNFDVKARRQVTSNDEVGDLAKAFDNMTEGLKERDKVKNLFSKFHGSSVAEDLIQNDIGVGGSKKQVCVFFSDIRGFTAFSESRTPEQVVAMLNEYFAVMVKIINKNHGVVDKFIGDAIMAIWGAPKGSDKDPQYALKACLEMRQALVELNEKRIARGEPAIMIGMGLHTGYAISGTIGSDERMEYTVIGDTVNMASRIEASTKAFGADLLVSEEIHNRVGEEFMFELGGSAEVKGKTEALKLYKVRGYKNEAGEWVEVRTPYSDYVAEKADKVKIAS